MNKKIKFLISLFFIFNLCILFQTSHAKYIIETCNIVAKLDIDRCIPNIKLLDITSSNDGYQTYANQTHSITGHIKVVEKNIVKNVLSSDNIKIKVGNTFVTPTFNNFSLISENENEKIYEFSFTNITGDGSLVINIPEGVIEDKSGLINEQKNFFTGIYIDNTPPTATFKEISSSDNKSKAEIIVNETIRSLSGWELSSDYKILTKEFTNYISYVLPITDFAQNVSNVLIDIQNATNILLQYGTYDDYSQHTLVTSGKISSPKTISDNSICKSEAIYTRISGNIPTSFLQGRCYLYTHWGDGARGVCRYSELPYYHGSNPTSNSSWFAIGSNNQLIYQGNIFTQLGGVGLNIANATASNIKTPIPSTIASQYLYGISGIQFQLADTSDFSVVYQSYVKDVGWLNVSSDGQENLYAHNKPISAFRMNIVPKTEKQYLIDFWERDFGTNNIN